VRRYRPLILVLALIALLLPLFGVFYYRTSDAVNAQNGSANQPKTQIGINLSALGYENNQRVFANLVATGRWNSAGSTPWQPMAATQLTPDGDVKFLLPGQIAPLFLTMPAGPFQKIAIKCRFEGKGKLTGDGTVRFRQQAGNVADFDIIWRDGNLAGFIQIIETNAKDPVRNIDCREADMDPEVFFDPAFIKSLRGFGNIRFLDWQWVNINTAGDWSKFLPENHQFITGAPEGVHPRVMIRLANEANIDPWFIMPYRADESYIRNFAAMVKKELKPSLKVYVELGNEIWNYANPSTQQALTEGKALRLSTNDHDAMLIRYAQKSQNALKIWTETFKGEEARLVRVVGIQNARPDTAKTVLGHDQLLEYVDAMATASYFYAKTKEPTRDTLDAFFTELDVSVNDAINLAIQNKAIASSFGKRYISYEAGQHVLFKDHALLTDVQRDPRMGVLYSKYLKLWKERVGDLTVFYALTGPITGSGGWGLREYADQPVADAPKWRAVQSHLN
jgi:hypothetical protein